MSTVLMESTAKAQSKKKVFLGSLSFIYYIVYSII